MLTVLLSPDVVSLSYSHSFYLFIDIVGDVLNSLPSIIAVLSVGEREFISRLVVRT